MLYVYFSHRERSRVIRELAVIAITCAGVAMLYLFYLYRFGNPFIVSSVEALNWKGTLSVANLFNNVGTYGFQTPARCPLTTPLCLFSWSTPFWWWRQFWRSSRERSGALRVFIRLIGRMQLRALQSIRFPSGNKG